MVQKNDRTLVEWKFYMQKVSSTKSSYPKKDQESAKAVQMQLHKKWKNVQNVRDVNFALGENSKT